MSETKMKMKNIKFFIVIRFSVKVLCFSVFTPMRRRQTNKKQTANAIRFFIISYIKVLLVFFLSLSLCRCASVEDWTSHSRYAYSSSFIFFHVSPWIVCTWNFNSEVSLIMLQCMVMVAEQCLVNLWTRQWAKCLHALLQFFIAQGQAKSFLNTNVNHFQTITFINV